MSPHILIDKMLEAITEPDSFDPGGIETLAQISNHFINGTITKDEFDHYCERQRKAVMRAPRRAA